MSLSLSPLIFAFPSLLLSVIVRWMITNVVLKARKWIIIILKNDFYFEIWRVNYWIKFLIYFNEKELCAFFPSNICERVILEKLFSLFFLIIKENTPLVHAYLGILSFQEQIEKHWRGSTFLPTSGWSEEGQDGESGRSVYARKRYNLPR